MKPYSPHSAVLLLPLLLLAAASLWAEPKPHKTRFTVVHAEGHFPPFEMRDQSGELKGFHIELIRAVSKKAGLEVRFLHMPWRRALFSALNGKVDAISFIMSSEERRQGLWFLPDNQLGSTVNAFIVKRGHPLEHSFNGDTQQLYPYRLGLIQDYKYDENLISDTAIEKDFTAKNESKLLQLLVNNRVDVALINTEVSRYLAKQDGTVDKITILPKAYPSVPQYLAFSKHAKTKALAEHFAQVYRQFRQSQEYQDLLQKYSLQAVESLQ